MGKDCLLPRHCNTEISLQMVHRAWEKQNDAKGAQNKFSAYLFLHTGELGFLRNTDALV